MSTDRGMKMPHICATEYYSAIKKDAVTPFAATWTDPGITVLSSAGQNRRTTTTRHHLHVESKNGTNGAGYETEPQREDRVARRRGWGRDGGGGWGSQMQAFIQRRDKQQGPTE